MLKVPRPPDIDVSRPAQIRDIEASFTATENFDLSALQHPNKPDVTAVESYEIFPDADIWANAYDLFRFSERPGERPLDVRSLIALRGSRTELATNIGMTRSKIHVWIVPFCVLWSLMATTFWRTTLQKTTRRLWNSSRRD